MDLTINNIEEALEKVKWYCLRWRIEVFHKILKSGLKKLKNVDCKQQRG